MILKRISPLVCVAALVAGCGRSSSSSQNAASPQQPAGGAGGSSSVLSAEAQATKTGDIADQQTFITFKNPAAGYSIIYPEGWVQAGSGSNVTFRDKNNLVHVQVAQGAAPTAASVAAELSKQQATTPTLKAGTPQPIALKGGPALKVTYTTESAPNPVTGKRVVLTVDRYVVAKAGRNATIDLGTPVGVDNVDAYKRMAQSFQWK